MYSGSDSTESQNYTQWALNPSAYQNMSNEQVDWAALAQQWIIMKEAGPPIPEHINKAPPPPIISKPHKKEPITEGGEAPMDVVNDDDGGQWNEGDDGYSWGQPQPPWGWNSSWPNAAASAAVPPPKAPLLPTPSFNNFGPPKTPPNENTNFNYNSVGSPGSGYWTAAGSSKVIKPHNKRYSKVNVPMTAKPPVTLDAAKRKQLPAWIREGLEKMERDKLKQMDKSRERLEKTEYEEKVRLRENALEILKSTVKEVETKKLSAYDDDSDDNESPPTPPRRSPTPLTYEEMMLKVRRTMTEILLKVTNREIQNICREELQRHVRKLKASDQRVSAPTGANLSAKLGLGAYEGSGDSSAESDEESNHGYHDSDSELRDIIRRRKEEFSKTERDIEDRLAEADRKGDTSRASTPDSETQVVAKVSDRRSRRSEDGTPPPKPNSHTIKPSRKRQSSPSSDSSSDRKRDRRDKRSTSSSETPKKSRRSRSRTPKSKKSKSKRSRSSSRRRESRRSFRSKGSRSRSRSRSYRKRNRRSNSRVKRRSESGSRKSRRRSASRRSGSRGSYKKSRSRSRSSRRHRRSRSYSSGRGKRSHRH